MALQEPRIDESAKPPGERVRGNRQGCPKVLEPLGAGESLTEDEYAPPLAYSLKAARDRTGHRCETGVAHVSETPLVSVAISLA